ncbi:MAG: helix-turn-helix domain-containing protein, partial [Candidatus Aenigmatarchaeota archaeon]
SSPDPLPCCELNPELQKLLRKRPIKHFSAYTMQNFINYLSEQDATKKQISKWLRKSHTTVENILRYLRMSGLIKSDRKHGKKLCYSLTENGSKLKS